MLLMPDLEVGDWVRIAIGTVIARVDAAEAQETNALLRQVQGTLT